MDATMRSNVTVGPPFDLLLYRRDSLVVERYRRVCAGDQDLNSIHASWEQSLRRAVEQLPDIEFEPVTVPARACEPVKSAESAGERSAVRLPGSWEDSSGKSVSPLAASGNEGRQPE
jgi:hypothetical protein